MSQRLLILSVSAGAGHVRAAQALEAAAKVANPPLEATHLDLLTLVPREFRKLYGEQYIKLVDRLPQLWSYLYTKTDRPSRDSLVGMAYVLQLMAETGKSVSQLVAEIPRYEIVKTKFECRREDANRAVEAVKKAFANEKVDTQDGIRIDWDRAWVHARPSNTEPIMRIIAEAPDRAKAEAKIAQVQEVVRRVLGS